MNNAASVANAFTNNGSPIQVFLTYDHFHATASAGTITSGGTNFVFNQWPVTNSAGAIAPHYLVLQLSTNLTTPAARWATAVTVDWIPRPPPMLTLPVADCNKPISSVHRAPTTFYSFKMRLITSTVPPYADGNPFQCRRDLCHLQQFADRGIPISLYTRPTWWSTATAAKSSSPIRASDFSSVNSCSNVIVEGFTVDYDPLPLHARHGDA